MYCYVDKLGSWLASLDFIASYDNEREREKGGGKLLERKRNREMGDSVF